MNTRSEELRTFECTSRQIYNQQWQLASKTVDYHMNVKKAEAAPAMELVKHMNNSERICKFRLIVL